MYKFAMMKKISFLVAFKFIFLFNLLGQNYSVLSDGDWYKITTNQHGIYKLDYSDFLDIGVNVSDLLISSIKLYGNGGGMLPRLNSDFRHLDLVENAIKVEDANNNGFFDNEDYILFYGMSPSVWRFNENNNFFEYDLHLFSDEVAYFLKIDSQSDGKRVMDKNISDDATKTITSYSVFANHELELENLIQSGREWFGERFSYDS